MKVLIANPRGFCAGVNRALSIVDIALQKYGSPLYVYHEIIHNDFVVDDFKKRGVVFVSEIEAVPNNCVIVFSAHGVSKDVWSQSQSKNLKVIDATCPLVSKVHAEIVKYQQAGYDCILIGHEGHDEVVGTLGQAQLPVHLVQSILDVDNLQINNPSKLAYTTQTTLSMDDVANIVGALQQKYPTIKGPKTDDICYATQNRQNAIKDFYETVQIVLVVGSKTSSNCTRLKEVAMSYGLQAHLINSKADLNQSWFTNVECVGVTAGASTPEYLVRDVVEELQKFGATSFEEQDGVLEEIQFTLPKF